MAILARSISHCSRTKKMLLFLFNSLSAHSLPLHVLYFYLYPYMYRIRRALSISFTTHQEAHLFFLHIFVFVLFQFTFALLPRHISPSFPPNPLSHCSAFNKFHCQTRPFPIFHSSLSYWSNHYSIPLSRNLLSIYSDTWGKNFHYITLLKIYQNWWNRKWYIVLHKDFARQYPNPTRFSEF